MRHRTDPHKLLGQYRHFVLTERYRSVKTWRDYRLVLLAFWGFCGKDPAKAQPADVHRFLDRRRPPLADSTRATYTAIIKGFYRWAAGERIFPADPMVGLYTPPARPGPPRALDVADVRKLLTAAQDDPRLHLMIWLAYGCGLRAAEIAGLRIEDTYLAGRPHIRVRGKGNKTRVVPLNARVADMLGVALAGRPQSGPVIANQGTNPRPGHPISPARVSRLLSWALRDVGIAATGHQLRHTFATEILAGGRGTNLRAVSRLLGHASIATTERYTGAFDADAVEAVQWLPDPEPNPAP